MAGESDSSYAAEQDRVALPPEIPQRFDVLVHVIDDPIWDIETARYRLVSQFDRVEHIEGLENSIHFAAPTLSKRWQLGYKPRLSLHDDGAVGVVYPSMAELGPHNRLRHSIEVASTAVGLGKAIGVGRQDLYALATGGIFHDYGHILFSHVGEAFVQHLMDRPHANESYGGFPEFEDISTPHEQRVIKQIEDPESELFKMLDQNGFEGDKKDQLIHLLSEKDMGILLNIADTCAYLNLDSIFFGYQAPHFEKYFAQILRYTPEMGVTIENSKRATDIVARFARYRHFMYQNQYTHPLTQALEQMQTLAFEDHFNSLPNEATQRRFLQEFIELDDSEILKRLRARVIVEQVGVGAAFFGIPLDGVRIAYEGEENGERSVIVDSNGKGKPKIMHFRTETGSERSFDISHDLKGEAISPFPPNAMLSFYQKADFATLLSPFLRSFASTNGIINGSSFTVEQMAEKLSAKGLPENQEFINELIAFARRDSSLSYRMQDVVGLSELALPQNPTEMVRLREHFVEKG